MKPILEELGGMERATGLGLTQVVNLLKVPERRPKETLHRIATPAAGPIIHTVTQPM